MASTTKIVNAAALGETFELEKLLKEPRAEVNWADKHGMTALHTAVQAGQNESVDILIKVGRANINQATKDGTTPLHLAALKFNVEAAKMLLQAGANPKATDRNYNTPLHTLAQGGNSEGASGLGGASFGSDAAVALAELLIKAGASSKDTNSTGKTPLHLAAKSGNVNLIQFLLKNGGDKNQQDKLGVTPAGYAESPAVAKLL